MKAFMVDPDRLAGAYRTARRELLAERNSAGHWTGELSASALSTPTALSALALARPELGHAPAGASSPTGQGGLVERGIAWLAKFQRADGGWGDTDQSL